MAQQPGPEERLYIHLGYLRALFGYLRAIGADLSAVLDAIGVTEVDLTDLDRRVDDAALNVAFAAAASVTNDPNIGIHAARSMRLVDLGILGHLLMCCRRVGELYDLHTRYAALVSNAHDSRYEDEGDVTCLHVFDRGGPHSRHRIDFSLGGWLHIVRFLGGSEFRLLRLDLRTEPSPLRAEHEEFFGCPVEYERPHVRVYLDKKLRDMPLFCGDAALRSALEAEVVRRLEALRGDQFGSDVRAAEIRRCVADRLAHGAPAIEDIAAKLSTSVRTLQRELARTGLTYRDLIDTVRRELAERYVRDRSISLVEIALMLGFSDQTAFQRAFRRWFDATPGSVRKPRVAG